MEHLEVIREARRRLATEGPLQDQAAHNFTTVTLPECDCDCDCDCDAVRDLLVEERPSTVVEIGLAFGSSALAIGEALVAVHGKRHIIVDPFQDDGFHDAGWKAICSAGLDCIATLLRERSQIALPRLADEGLIAQPAFVDESHIFHNIFVDLFYLQMIVQPGKLVILDDYWWPGVATAARYFETSQGWQPQTLTNGTPGRLHVLRLPDRPVQPDFKTLTPFWLVDGSLKS